MVANFPFHPPYALMIGEAIRSLKEDGGSTESAISEYIKANFDGLPVAHHRLLPYYLTKLTVQGEFGQGPDGRLFITDDDCVEAEPPLAKRRVSKKRPKVRRNVGRLALKVFDEMTMDDKYGADPLVLTDSEAEGWESIPKRRGRPPKIPKRRGRPSKRRLKPLDVDGAKKALVLARSERMTDKCVVYMKSAPRRRGRPPKKKDMSVDPSSLGTNGNDAELQVSEEVDALGKEKHDDESKQVAKRCVKPPQRGRKSKKGSDQNAYLNLLTTKTDNGDVDMMQLVNSSSLGTNGNAVEPTINGGGGEKQADKSKQVPPERRGRPPKMKHEFTDSSKVAIVCERDGDKPKRGRKSKKGSDQNAYLNLLKTTTDNGYVQLIQLMASSSLVTSGSAVEPTINGGGAQQDDKSKQVPKRRGRPPKMKHEFTDGSQDAILCVRDGDKPKRRSKSKKCSDQNADLNLLKTTTDNGEVQLIQLMDSCSLGTNGSDVEPTINAGGEEKQDDKSKQVTKRRGRPPKMKHEFTDSSKDAILCVIDGDKHKRRRKSKKISTQNEETELLKTKTGDGDGLSIVLAETMGPNVDFPKRRGRPPKSKPTELIVSVKEKQKDESSEAPK